LSRGKRNIRDPGLEHLYKLQAPRDLIGLYFDSRSGQDTYWQTMGTLIGLFAGFLVVVVMVTKGANRP
jgi:hypothetical protein